MVPFCTYADAKLLDPESGGGTDTDIIEVVVDVVDALIIVLWDWAGRFSGNEGGFCWPDI